MLLIFLGAPEDPGMPFTQRKAGVERHGQKHAKPLQVRLRTVTLSLLRMFLWPEASGMVGVHIGGVEKHSHGRNYKAPFQRARMPGPAQKWEE